MQGDVWQKRGERLIVEKKHRCVVIYLLGIIAVILFAYVLLCFSRIGTTEYVMHSDKIDTPFRIILLADGHNAVFGDGNTQLLHLIAEQSPDAILVVGDMVNGHELQTDSAEQLLRGLCGIAPVYASYGNHEIRHEQEFGSDLHARYEACGAVMLEDEWQEIEIGGQAIRLGGIYGYCLPESALATGEARIEECEYLRAFQDTELFTLLMCHMPSGWNTFGGLDAWDINCVVAGHAHGGQIILPLIGGVYAPDQGWFPGRVHGVFESEAQDSTLIVSRGLGSSVSVPRIGNPPEVVVIDFFTDER